MPTAQNMEPVGRVLLALLGLRLEPRCCLWILLQLGRVTADVIEVNLNAVFRFCQLAGRRMLAQGGGKIINIASLLSFQGGILAPSYAAAKGAVAQLTKALANEWATGNVNVNAIAPGYMATDNTAALRADPVRSKAILDRIPAGRWGTPQDVGGAAVFLASPASDYVTGHVLLVDGGWMAR